MEPQKQRPQKEKHRREGVRKYGKGKGKSVFWSQVGSYFHYILTCKIKPCESIVSVLLIIISLELGDVLST